MSACQQKSVADGWMKGRNSTPKQRALCQCCLDWLVGDGLAECMPQRSDATLVLHQPWPDSGQKRAAPGLQRQLSTSSSLESGEIREDLDGSDSDSATEPLVKKAKVCMPAYLDRHGASADWMGLRSLWDASQGGAFVLRAKRTAEKCGIGYKGFFSTSGDKRRFVPVSDQVRVHESFVGIVPCLFTDLVSL